MEAVQIMNTKTNTQKSTKSDTTEAPTFDVAAVVAYRDADQSGKGKLRAEWTQRMHKAVDDLDLDAAKFAKATLDEFVTKSQAAREQVDPRVVIAQRIADLRHAADMLSRGEATPTDLAVPEWSDSDFVGGHLVLPDVEPNSESATKVATAKLTRTDQRRSIQTVIDNAFEGVEEGDFLSVADIRKRGQWEGYEPSDGAIAARLFPRDGGDCTLEGVEPVEAVPGKSPRGAVKA